MPLVAPEQTKTNVTKLIYEDLDHISSIPLTPTGVDQATNAFIRSAVEYQTKTSSLTKGELTSLQSQVFQTISGRLGLPGSISKNLLYGHPGGGGVGLRDEHL